MLVNTLTKQMRGIIMKKHLQVLCLTIILIFTLSACSSNNQASNAITNTIALPEATTSITETINIIPEPVTAIVVTTKPQTPTAAPVAAVVTKAVVAEQPKTVMVHITATGEKYHNAGCRYLAKSDTEVTLSTALSKGLTPCSVCNPPSK